MDGLRLAVFTGWNGGAHRMPPLVETYVRESTNNYILLYSVYKLFFSVGWRVQKLCLLTAGFD